MCSILFEIVESRSSFRKIACGSKATGPKMSISFSTCFYRDFDYSPLFDGNMPQVDHIFPQSELSRLRMLNPETGRNSLMKYKKPQRDQLANCMLLTAFENGFAQKNDALPTQWTFRDEPDKYLEAHLIPTDRNLWKLENFEAFVDARKALIQDRLKHFLLVRADT